MSDDSETITDRASAGREKPSGGGQHVTPLRAGSGEARARNGAARGGSRRRRPGARDFTEERMLRAPVEEPRTGWRRAVFQLTGGRVNLGPNEAEELERALIGRAKTRIDGCRRVAVMCRKGGVGKTCTTVNLGHQFASLRGDRVVAVDANPDAGSLAERVRRETTNTIIHLLSAQRDVARYADIRAFTSQASSRLEVVAAPDDPRITEALGESDFRRVASLLEVHYNLILFDCGTGILSSATRGVLAMTDALVIPVPPSLDGARVSAQTLDWLDQQGHDDLVREAVVAINKVGAAGSRLVDIDEIEAHFRERCRAVVRIPYDPVLDAGGGTALERLRPSTQRAYLRLAAVVADGFATTRGEAP